MPDPITCPQCEGRAWEPLGPLRIECAFCHGRGMVGDPDPDPDTAPPKRPPPVWEDRRWRDAPATNSARSLCRYCFGAREVCSLAEESRTLVSAPCPACAEPGAA